MRLVFAGTPLFAAVALEALVAAGHEIALVLTQPDRAAGRGMKLLFSEVKQAALKAGLPLYQPASLRDPVAVETLAATGADAMVVAAYGLILPRDVLALFPYGCINIHASLLPRWRGAAPIQHALLAGDRETGICIMRMDEGLDTGPVYLRTAIEIESGETAASLHDKLAKIGAQKIVEALEDLATGELKPHAQPHEGATYAHKISKHQADIDWTRPATEIERAVRAFNPFPGAFSHIEGETIKIWAAEIPVHFDSGQAAQLPGEIVAVDDAGIDVRCGDGLLRLLQLQRAGGKRLTAAEFLRGFPLVPKQRFGE